MQVLPNSGRALHCCRFPQKTPSSSSSVLQGGCFYLWKPHPSSIVLEPGPTSSLGCPWLGFTHAPGLVLELQPCEVLTGLRGTRREFFVRCS